VTGPPGMGGVIAARYGPASRSALPAGATAERVGVRLLRVRGNLGHDHQDTAGRGPLPHP